MYKNFKIGVVVPAYNEEKLIIKTLSTIPSFVDYIIVVNDASTDETEKKIVYEQKKNKKITLISNKKNLGIGGSLKKALKESLVLKCDKVAVMAGDAQMDPDLLHEMIDEMTERNLDYIKANRFMHLDALKDMPSYRRIGNIIVTLLTKVATGYYSIFDTQNGYVVYDAGVIKRMPWRIVGNRYEFENTILIALSILNARVGDFAAPAIYNDEQSTIKVFSTTLRVLRVLCKGYWQRIYYKYILYNFHPIALFIFGSIIFGTIGALVGSYLIIIRVISNITPTSASVMLAVLPLLIGLQLSLTAFILDVMEDKKN